MRGWLPRHRAPRFGSFGACAYGCCACHFLSRHLIGAGYLDLISFQYVRWLNSPLRWCTVQSCHAVPPSPRWIGWYMCCELWPCFAVRALALALLLLAQQPQSFLFITSAWRMLVLLGCCLLLHGGAHYCRDFRCRVHVICGTRRPIHQFQPQCILDNNSCCCVCSGCVFCDLVVLCCKHAFCVYC